MLKSMAAKNACKSCALGMGGQKGGLRDEKGRFPAVCNKSFLAQASDMQPPLPMDFFQRHDIETLSQWSPRDLELSGRLTQPVICENNGSHFQAITWDNAIQRIVDELKNLTPDEIFFYASGRSSNEAGFLLQLFARLFGANNVNNCSYYCHQASGVGLSESLGTGTATVDLDDLDGADLIFLIGANPASNHPRFMTLLMETRRRGGEVVVINPAREAGLENFKVPSDVRSLLFGSEIASHYLQPNIGGDIALCKGIAKSLFKIAEDKPEVIDQGFIENHTEEFHAFKQDIERTSWERIETDSGISRTTIEKTGSIYSRSKNAIFAWAMGITHHVHGVENVQAIVNLALMRGMVGRKDAGLLPLRGHSNVQGIGSVGVTPQLKQAIFDNLQSRFNISLPTKKGLDTLGCMEAIGAGELNFAWNLGGNLYGSNPDSTFAGEALSRLDFALYMNTTLNQGHFKGRGKTTLILPVLSRDEEPEPTTQESMFSYVRLSDGGQNRYTGPRSEVSIIAEVAAAVLPSGPIDWNALKRTGNIRQLIGDVIPGFESMKEIDSTRKEFHIGGRILHSPHFPTQSGKARFQVFPMPAILKSAPENRQFRLLTMRSEGQFNTVVYDLEDRYRGVESRNVVLMNPADIEAAGLKDNDRVSVKNETGTLKNQKIISYPVKAGNIMMYYPEANVLVPRVSDGKSKTPSFKSIQVQLEVA